MQNKAFDRETESVGIAFAHSLKSGLTPKEILTLFESLEKEHAIIETKIAVMKALFFGVLDEEFRKQEAAMPDGVASIFH